MIRSIFIVLISIVVILLVHFVFMYYYRYKFRKDLDISDNGNTKLERLLFKVFSKFKHEPLCLYVMLIEFIIYVGMVITMIKII